MERYITIRQPQHVQIGSGSAAQIGLWAADAQKVLVLTSKSTTLLVEHLQLKQSAEIYSYVPAEPDDYALQAALEHAALHRPDVIIGLGGGSVMDIAKLVSVMWGGSQRLEEIIGADKVLKRFSKLALIPTTAGTGSEAGIRALVTNSKTQAKMAVESRLMCADLAILDPDLTLSVSPSLTAFTGIDAMAHCVEAFTNIRSHQMIDGYARMGFSAVGKYLGRVVADKSDSQARLGMMLASYYGGICLGPVNTAAGHALAYPLGTKLKLAHGLANALMFPHVLGFNQPVCPDKTNEVLSALGGAKTENSASAHKQAYDFCESLSIDMNLSNYGAQASHLRAWAEEAFAIRRLMDNNPREMTVDDIEQIYQNAL
mgnify:FL=1